MNKRTLLVLMLIKVIVYYLYAVQTFVIIANSIAILLYNYNPATCAILMMCSAAWIWNLIFTEHLSKKRSK